MKMTPLSYACNCQARVISCFQGTRYIISDFSFQHVVSGVRNSKASCTAVKGDLGAECGNKAGTASDLANKEPDCRVASQGPTQIRRQWPGWATVWCSPGEWVHSNKAGLRPGQETQPQGLDLGFWPNRENMRPGTDVAQPGGPAVEPQPKSSSQGKGGAAPAWSFLHNSSYQQRSWPWMQPATLLNLPNYTPRRRLCSGPWQIQCNAALVKPMKQPWSTTCM